MSKTKNELNQLKTEYEAVNTKLQELTEDELKQVEGFGETRIYQYMTQNTDFAEEHKGLQDALIEKDIFAYCMAQKVKLRKRCFN